MQTETESQIQKVELTIEQAETSLARMHCLNRLYENKDFQKLILKGYFKDEASRIVLLRADINMQSKDQQKQVDTIITGIGALHQYFNTVYQLGMMADRAITENEGTREELLQEQLEEDAL